MERRLLRFLLRIQRHSMLLSHSFRVTVSAMLALAAAQFLNLPMSPWAALTAMIVTQISVGRSLKATGDYFAGTVGGALYGGAIALLLPHSSEFALLLVLAVAVAPLTLLAAFRPRFNVAPITAAIVILIPTITHTSPVASAVNRVLEVALGGTTAFAVSFLLLPLRADAQALSAAGETLEHMARALSELLTGLERGLEMTALHGIQDHIGRGLAQLETLGAEAEQERSVGLGATPGIRPLLDSLLQLRHDLVMVGRVTLAPLPSDMMLRLGAPIEAFRLAAARYLRASAAALLTRSPPPSPHAVEATLEAYADEVRRFHETGLTGRLDAETAERFFALAFTLQQIQRNFQALEHSVAQWARR